VGLVSSLCLVYILPSVASQSQKGGLLNYHEHRYVRQRLGFAIVRDCGCNGDDLPLCLDLRGDPARW
jgi:hypothetical protein